MRRVRRLLLPGLAGVTILAGSLAFAADVLSQFRLTEADAKQEVFSSFWEGRPSDFGGAASIFRSLSPEARATAVTAAAAFVRTYCESDAFRQQYTTMRQQSRPMDITAKPVSEAEVDRQSAQNLKGLEAMADAMKNMPPEMRKMAEEAMKAAGGSGDLEAAIAEGEKATKEAAAATKKGAADTNKKLAQHQQSQKEFDATYPVSPEKFLAGRLREFLALTASVPFDAPMQTRGDKKYFVDPALEKKPESWKRLYRAGKPSVDAARSAATAWLAKLEGR